ncbi:hypothetical protein Swit_4961 (plasmid) [Rhizorhabdus wittichii RW1]|uniref:CN hydrolase domain-containing protein n=1 Tax=Rhizorhabdus wittichii (strain DSM 6014 / CCUG 31198 / JCM 15750 / NBRC 105917 / EY 4224 / RW1) TaxID=392499 RepID=A0A9J9HH41_RHIWR|nr:hypothetical protein Swit_4961 [Rhizorhabdus wittichii RW1]
MRRMMGGVMDREFWIDFCERVPGAPGGLDEARWRSAVDHLICDLSRYYHVTNDVDLYLSGSAEEPSLRELFLWTYMTMKATPAEFLQVFKTFHERDLDWAEREAIQSFFELGEAPDAFGEILLGLGGVLRALDGFLASVTLDDAPAFDERGKPARRWEMPSYGAYIAPVDRQRRSGVNRPFIRRGLKNHAILPTRIGNNDVTLHYHDQLLDGERLGDRQRLRYGAALFPDLEVDLSKDDSWFHVKEIICERHGERIQGHLDEAHGAGCDMLLWPELTLDWDAIDAIQSALQDGARRERKKMTVVLAGSAHVHQDEPRPGHRNRTRIFNGRGETLADYDKRMMFSFAHKFLPDGAPDPDAARCYEKIQPGNNLPILVLEDRLVAVAICLDFCEKTSGLLPYHQLDVDLVLVPSMGFRNTTDQHLEQAHTMDVEYDTQVFLVQQTPLIAGDQARKAGQPAGYSILHPPPQRHELEQNEAFRTFCG